MGWFFSDDNDDDIFSGLFNINIGDIIGNLFGGGLSSLFGIPQEFQEPQIESSPYAHLSERERDFYEKIKIVIGEETEQINPDSPYYEAHKMRLVFELEEDMLFASLPEEEREEKLRERTAYCRDRGICTNCFEKLEENICAYCNTSI